MQELADRINGLAFRGLHTGEFFRLTGVFIDDGVLGGFHVGPVIALLTENDGVLAGRCQKHIFMGDAAAHHTGIRFDGHDFGDAGPLENTVVGIVALLIVILQVLLAGMEGIGVLHGKFTDTDHAGAGPCLVTEFPLDLVDHERILLIRGSILSDKLYRCFFVGHAKDMFGPVPVFKTDQFPADRVVTAGLFPQIRGHNDGEEDFLSVDGVHLLTDDLLDLGGDPAKDGIFAENAVADIFHVAAADHQRMAGDLRVGRVFFEALAYQIFEFHRISSFLFYCVPAVCP